MCEGCVSIEYAVNIYDCDGDFVRQSDVYQSLGEAKRAKVELGDGESVGIVAIEYDERENELASYRVA